MARGVSRDPENLIAEVDQQITRLQARRAAVVARERQKRQRKDELQARIAGKVIRHEYGSLEAPQFLAWIERFLISDRDRAAFGLGPLDTKEKERRLVWIREREAHRESRLPANAPAATSD